MAREIEPPPPPRSWEKHIGKLHELTHVLHLREGWRTPAIRGIEPRVSHGSSSEIEIDSEQVVMVLRSNGQEDFPGDLWYEVLSSRDGFCWVHTYDLTPVDLSQY